MAVLKPIVLKNGELQQLQPGDSIGETQLISLVNDDSAAMAIGEVAYISSAGAVEKARADALATTEAFYFATQAIASSAAGYFQSSGVLSGLAGLTAGATYYLSPTTAGLITVTPVSATGQYNVRLGKAVSATEFEIRIERPILL